MTTRVALSPKAVALGSAIYTYLRPKLAQDARVDIASCLAPLAGGKQFADVKPAIANAVRSVTVGKLAKDADIQDVAQLLDAVQPFVEAPEEAVPTGMGEENGEYEIPDEEEARDGGIPEELCAQIRELIASSGNEKLLGQFDQLVGSGGEAMPPRGEEGGDLPEEEEEEEDMTRDSVPRAAMDAAIRKAIEGERQNQASVRRAFAAVEAVTGKLAMDSAPTPADVYRAGLGVLKVKTDGIPAEAYQAVFEAHVAGQRSARAAGGQQGPRGQAHDAALPAGVGSFAERHPGAARISIRG